MKHIILIIAAINEISVLQLHASLPGLTPRTNSAWLKFGTIGKEHKKLINSVKSYPSMGTFLNEDGTTHTAHQYPNNRGLNGTLPPEIISTIRNGKFSVLRGKKEDFSNYPKGATLFADYPVLATKFDALINLMVTKPTFKAFFNKVHLNILNELYEYLMNIYTNFNLQHVGITETKNQQGNNSLVFNIPFFLQNETEYDANKKTLIINHLVNVIESQMNGKIKSIMPDIPHLFATSAGKTLIQNDYSIDITQFIIKQIEPGMVKYKQLYLEGLATYLSFFQEFTSLLLKPHPKKSQHFTAFVHVAEAINQFLFDSNTVEEKNSDSKKQMAKILKKMNPPLFTFNYDDLRALKLLPHLAKSLSLNSKSIEWPSHITTAAEQGTMVSGHPIAYFKDNNDKVVTEKQQATHLFIVLQSGANYFQEELVAQPDWLNKSDGVINIIRACFGDFSALLGLNIIDPCMETLVQNAVNLINGKQINEENSLALTCKSILNDITNLKENQSKSASTSQSAKTDNILPPENTPGSIPQPNEPQTPSNNLIPTSNNLIPSDNSLTPSDQSLSPSSSNDISDSLNQ